MRFEDKHEYNGRYCYGVINEHLDSWREALGDVANLGGKRAASICSGGEVGFFLLLPFVKESLTMIDYSYGSMFYALGKYHLIEKLGAPKAREEILSLAKEYAEYRRAVDATYYGRYNYSTGRNEYAPQPPTPREDLWQQFVNAAKGFPKKAIDDAKNSWPLGNIDQIWNDISVEEVAAFRRNRTKVNFVHGDISQLADTGPYDFVYFSNALQYHSAKHKVKSAPIYDVRGAETQYEMDKIIKPGGHALFCYQGSRARQHYDGHITPTATCMTDWEVVASITPQEYTKRKKITRRAYGMGWTYDIVQAPA